MARAYDKHAKSWTDVPAGWIDHPSLFGGRFVSTKPSRAQREPVNTPEPAPSDGDHTTKE